MRDAIEFVAKCGHRGIVRGERNAALAKAEELTQYLCSRCVSDRFAEQQCIYDDDAPAFRD